MKIHIALHSLGHQAQHKSAISSQPVEGGTSKITEEELEQEEQEEELEASVVQDSVG